MAKKSSPPVGATDSVTPNSFAAISTDAQTAWLLSLPNVATKADKVKHVIVRCALLNALIGDRRVIAAFNDWSRYTRIGDLVEAAAARLDKFAVGLGLETRAQLFEERSGDLEIDKASAVLVNRCVQTLTTRGCKFRGRRLGDILLRLTHTELRLPWPFVPFELHAWYLQSAMYFIRGQMFELVVQPDGPKIVQGLAKRLRTALRGLRDDADPAEVLGRVKTVFSPAPNAGLPAGRLPKGLAKDGGAYLEEYARWFYRHRCRKESVRKLAREYSQLHSRPEGSDDRPTIYAGMREAERLLNLAVTLPAL